ncbi:MAG TPA: hypothetical protein VGT98_09125, partial [Candidatus Elarobacter sp.]|nr:hypothetical protein [Candidatus Elarobacter sp.]
MGIAQWPSLAVGYRLSGDGAADPAVALTLTLQLDAYTVSPELSVERALRNAETDRATYARAGPQLAEPGVGFALSTTLEHSVGGTPVSHPLDIEPFRSFVTSALAFLDALCATQPADFDVSIGTAPIPVAAKFAGPIVPLRVTVTQTRDPASIEATPQGALRSLFALDAFARSVETALPGVHVATDELGGGDDDAFGRRLWLVNAASPRGPVVKFAFEPASEVRSFAIPPLSTSLASGSVMVTPYVTGSGLSGAPEPRVFAAIDLDTWAFTFLEAMDLVPAPDDALDTITGAKRALATAIAARVQHVLAHDTAGESGSSARRRDAAIAAVQRSLHAALANAYAIQCVVQP